MFVPLAKFEHLNILGKTPQESMVVNVYNGEIDPFVYVDNYNRQHWEREGIQHNLWVHKYIHNIGLIPISWHLHEEIRW